MGIASAQAVAVTDTGPEPRKVEILPRYPMLDGLRGIAILAVVIAHGSMAAVTDKINHIDRLVNLAVRILGPAGVDLFFVLSGFLITAIMDSTRNATRPFFTFYARRILRIVPLYYLYVLLIPILFSWAGRAAIGTPSDRIWDFAFLTNVIMTQRSPDQFGFLFGHFWSLAIEEHFYVLWPLFVFLVPRKAFSRVCVVLIGASVMLRAWYAISRMAQYGWLLMPARLDGLMCGALIAIAVADNPARVRAAARGTIKPVTLLAAVYFVGMLAGWWRAGVGQAASFGTQYTPRFIEIVVLPLIGALFFSCIVALAVTEERSLPKWVSAEWLRQTGRYSYGMALLHSPILILLAVVTARQYKVAGTDLPYQILWITALVIASRIVGKFTWNSFEKKILKFAPAYRFPGRAASRGST